MERREDFSPLRLIDSADLSPLYKFLYVPHFAQVFEGPPISSLKFIACYSLVYMCFEKVKKP